MKWMGALLILLGCGGSGFYLAASYRREEGMLQQLLDSIGWMLCELRCHGTDLPALFFRLAQRTPGPLGVLYEAVAQQLSNRVAPDAHACMQSALVQVSLPEKVRTLVISLGHSLGEFHLEGQLRQLEGLQMQCGQILEEHRRSRDSRVRTYQTIGVCSGMALAILLL